MKPNKKWLQVIRHGCPAPVFFTVSFFPALCFNLMVAYVASLAVLFLKELSAQLTDCGRLRQVKDTGSAARWR